MFEKCPGAVNQRTPVISYKNCPQCGARVEVASNDMQTPCDQCGFVIYTDVASCVQWCQYAEQCVGKELYAKLKKPAPGGQKEQ